MLRLTFLIGFLLRLGFSQEAQSVHNQGKAIYEGQCAPCHGMTGEGGYGSPLAVYKLPRASTDAAMFRVIRGGIAGTNMPGFGLTPDAEIWQVVQYVKSFSAVAPTKSPGNPANGKIIYESKGACSTCHILRGTGSGFGPDLTEVGARRNIEYLRKKLIVPGEQVTQNYWTMRIVPRDQAEFRGLWINEDSFTIQVRDEARRLRSFRKSSLSEFNRIENTSLMPSYSKTLSQSEIDDVVSYLAERGRQ